jgi:hypothetical protein
MRVPSMLCPHITVSKRESDRKQYGEHSFLYRSMHLAEFTDHARLSIVTPGLLRANLEAPRRFCLGYARHSATLPLAVTKTC